MVTANSEVRPSVAAAWPPEVVLSFNIFPFLMRDSGLTRRIMEVIESVGHRRLVLFRFLYSWRRNAQNRRRVSLGIIRLYFLRYQAMSADSVQNERSGVQAYSRDWPDAYPLLS